MTSYVQSSRLPQPYTVVVLKLKQLLTIYFTVPTTYMNNKLYWTASNLSFLISGTNYSFIYNVFFFGKI